MKGQKVGQEIKRLDDGMMNAQIVAAEDESVAMDVSPFLCQQS